MSFLACFFPWLDCSVYHIDELWSLSRARKINLVVLKNKRLTVFSKILETSDPLFFFLRIGAASSFQALIKSDCICIGQFRTTVSNLNTVVYIGLILAPDRTRLKYAVFELFWHVKGGYKVLFMVFSNKARRDCSKLKPQFFKFELFQAERLK